MHHITYCDFLGQTPSLYINKNSVFKTFLGGILSLIVVLLTVASIGFFSISLFDRSNFSVIVSEEYDSSSSKNWTSGGIALVLLDRYFNEISDADRLFTVSAQFWWNKSLKYPNGTPYFNLTIAQVELEKCNTSEHFGEYQDLWNDVKLINSSACLRRDQDIFTQKDFGADNYTGLVYWISRCVNSTQKTDCYPSQVIEEQLTNVFFQIKFLDYYFDNYLRADPAKPYIFTDTVQASSSSYKRVWYKFKSVLYSSDDGYIFSDPVDYNYQVFSETREATDLRTVTTVPETFAVVSINSVEKKQVHSRKYYKLQNFLADIGGLLKGLILVASIINYPVSSRLYHKELANCNIKNYLIPNEVAPKDMRMPNTISVLRPIRPVTPILKKLSNATNQFGIGANNAQEVKYDACMRKYRPIQLNCSQKIFPKCCFKKDSNRRLSLQKLDFLAGQIIDQLDVNVLLQKLNMVDKLCYILVGRQYRAMLLDIVNPYLSCHSHREGAEMLEKQKNEQLLNLIRDNFNSLISEYHPSI